jgi:hypothetical protein
MFSLSLCICIYMYGLTYMDKIIYIYMYIRWNMYLWIHLSFRSNFHIWGKNTLSLRYGSSVPSQPSLSKSSVYLFHIFLQ